MKTFKGWFQSDSDQKVRQPSKLNQNEDANFNHINISQS